MVCDRQKTERYLSTINWIVICVASLLEKIKKAATSAGEKTISIGEQLQSIYGILKEIYDIVKVLK